jgi:hypothetical protein
MSVVLNEEGVTHARWLIERGRVAEDERDDWSEHAPSADEENAFISKKGFEQYCKWHLGIDYEQSEDTKGRFSFPYGDFKSVHRCAVISLESRAAQYGHDAIARVAKELLGLIDR